MKRISGLKEAHITEKTAVTVGKFDGIHRGHELLTRKIVSLKNRGLASCVVTFDVSPRTLLEKEDAKTLITNEERAVILDKEGVDYLVECVFDAEMMHMEPEAFVDLLLKNLQMSYMVVGSDFSFGYKGRGNAALLRQLAFEKHFGLDVEKKLQEDHQDISSTRIRKDISEGRIEEANELLGYPYFIYGEVVHGRHLGHSIGIPTINVQPPAGKLLPPYGVYATEIHVGERVYHGMTDVGVKPTVQGDGKPVIETHILNFDQNLYGKKVRIDFLKHTRPEQKFDSLEALEAQLHKDRDEIAEYFQSYNS